MQYNVAQEQSYKRFVLHTCHFQLFCCSLSDRCGIVDFLALPAQAGPVPRWQWRHSALQHGCLINVPQC